MSQNPDSVTNQGEFHGRVAPSQPLQSNGHQPGKLVGNEKVPTFEAKTLPAGSAPKKDSYEPNPELNNQKLYQDASTTLTGADSSSVHAGLGHPGQGQTSSELRSDRKEGKGLAGLAQGVPDKGVGHGVESLKDDPKHAVQRNLDNVPTGKRGNTGGPAAEEREPVKAEQL